MVPVGMATMNTTRNVRIMMNRRPISVIGKISTYQTVSSVDTAHQMPEKALVNTAGWASCSRLYMHRLEASMRIRMMNTDENSCCR